MVGWLPLVQSLLRLRLPLHYENHSIFLSVIVQYPPQFRWGEPHASLGSNGWIPRGNIQICLWKSESRTSSDSSDNRNFRVVGFFGQENHTAFSNGSWRIK